MLLIKLAEAHCHLAGTGARSCHQHQRTGGLHILIRAEALVADDMLDVVGISFDVVMLVHRDAQLFAPAGHEVALQQFTLVERAPLATVKSKGDALVATSSLHETIIGNDKVQLKFNAETAQLTALAFNGKNIITDGQGFIYSNHRWIENDRQGYDYYGPDSGKEHAQTQDKIFSIHVTFL